MATPLRSEENQERWETPPHPLLQRELTRPILKQSLLRVTDKVSTAHRRSVGAGGGPARAGPADVSPEAASDRTWQMGHCWRRAWAVQSKARGWWGTRLLAAPRPRVPATGEEIQAMVKVTKTREEEMSNGSRQNDGR